MKAQSYFTPPDIIRLHTANVLSFIERGVACYVHACDSILNSIDRIQTRLLRSVGVSDDEALLNFRLAPLSMGRCIALLGFLHRIVLGRASPQIQMLFPRAAARSVRDRISARPAASRSAMASNSLIESPPIQTVQKKYIRYGPVLQRITTMHRG